jgi:hypothetical protein
MAKRRQKIIIDFDAETSQALDNAVARDQRNVEVIVSDAVERMMARDYFERDLIRKDRSQLTAYERYLSLCVRRGN